MEERAVVEIDFVSRGEVVDIDTPLSINPQELIKGLNEAYRLGLSEAQIAHYYLRANRPTALMHGNKTLSYYGIRNGSVIVVSE